MGCGTSMFSFIALPGTSCVSSLYSPGLAEGMTRQGQVVMKVGSVLGKPDLDVIHNVTGVAVSP